MNKLIVSTIILSSLMSVNSFADMTPVETGVVSGGLTALGCHGLREFGVGIDPAVCNSVGAAVGVTAGVMDYQNEKNQRNNVIGGGARITATGQVRFPANSHSFHDTRYVDQHGRGCVKTTYYVGNSKEQQEARICQVGSRMSLVSGSVERNVSSNNVVGGDRFNIGSEGDLDVTTYHRQASNRVINE